ncbi:hypothetical protein RJT34_24467 [Clitoria ternatea]|uniref:Uncharacterized protein n=1 Tax=Clitoria ternatea TaxID=43366 RepID=A0AAN9IJ89_CLITE
MVFFFRKWSKFNIILPLPSCHHFENRKFKMSNKIVAVFLHQLKIPSMSLVTELLELIDGELGGKGNKREWCPRMKRQAQGDS